MDKCGTFYHFMENINHNSRNNKNNNKFSSIGSRSWNSSSSSSSSSQNSASAEEAINEYRIIIVKYIMCSSIYIHKKKIYEILPFMMNGNHQIIFLKLHSQCEKSAKLEHVIRMANEDDERASPYICEFRQYEEEKCTATLLYIIIMIV